MRYNRRMKLKLLAIFATLFLALAPAVPVFADTTAQDQINYSLKCGSNFVVPPSGNCDVYQSSDELGQKIQHLVNIMSAVVGIVAVIMIIFGGFRYVTSGGNDTGVTSAKNTILYAIIGLVIVAMSQILVHFTIKSISG